MVRDGFCTIQPLASAGAFVSICSNFSAGSADPAQAPPQWLPSIDPTVRIAGIGRFYGGFPEE